MGYLDNSNLDKRIKEEVKDNYSYSETVALKSYKAIVILDIPVLNADGEDTLESLTGMEGGTFINSTQSKDFIVQYLKTAISSIDKSYNSMTLNEMKIKAFISIEALKKVRATKFDIIFLRNSDWTEKTEEEINKYIRFSISKSKNYFGLGMISPDNKYSLQKFKDYKGYKDYRGFMIENNCCTDSFKIKDLAISYKESRMYTGMKPSFAENELLLSFDKAFSYKIDRLFYDSLSKKKESTDKSKLYIFNTSVPFIIADKETLASYGIDISKVNEYEKKYLTSDAYINKDLDNIIIPESETLDNFCIFSPKVSAVYAASAFNEVMDQSNLLRFYSSRNINESLTNYSYQLQSKVSDITTKRDIQEKIESFMVNGSLLKSDLSYMVFYSNIIFALDAPLRRIFEGEATNSTSLSLSMSIIMQGIKEALTKDSIINSAVTFEYTLTEGSAGNFTLYLKIKDTDESKEFEYSIDLSRG